MSIALVYNGSSYIIPTPGELGWGSNLDSFFVAIAAGSLQKSGGSFTLSAETDFGGAFGIKSLYLKSRTANPATTGNIRLANGDNISWRNNLNTLDLPLSVNASNQLTFNGIPLGGGGGVTYPLTAPDGSVGAPSYSFSTDPTTGIYFTNPGSVPTLNVANAGLNILHIDSTGLIPAPGELYDLGSSTDYWLTTYTRLLYLDTLYQNPGGHAYFDDGTVSQPAVNFISNGASGLYYEPNILGIAHFGVAAAKINSFQQFLFTDGVALTPAISFILDSDTGIYRSGSGIFNFVSNNTLAATVTSGNFQVQNTLVLKNTINDANISSPVGATGTSSVLFEPTLASSNFNFIITPKNSGTDPGYYYRTQIALLTSDLSVASQPNLTLRASGAYNQIVSTRLGGIGSFNPLVLFVNDLVTTDLGMYISTTNLVGVNTFSPSASLQIGQNVAASNVLNADGSLVVSNAGVITQPLQPSFLAWNSISLLNITGTGTSHTIVFDQEVYDQANNYDLATGIFTAPVQGRYLLTFTVNIKGILISHTSKVATLVTTARQYSTVDSALIANAETSYTVTTIADMGIGDTAYCTITVAGISNTIELNNAANTTYFSGSLLN